MTTTEIINEIHRLPLAEQAEIKRNLFENADVKSETREPLITEEEFLQYLLAKGVITHIPAGMTDEEDDFKPIKIEGEPLSETIIRERR